MPELQMQSTAAQPARRRTIPADNEPGRADTVAPGTSARDTSDPSLELPALLGPSLCVLEELCEVSVRTFGLRRCMIVTTIGQRTLRACAEDGRPSSARWDDDILEARGRSVGMGGRRRGDYAASVDVPLVRGAEHLGTLHLHADEPRHWRVDDIDRAHRLGMVAAAYIDLGRRLWSQRQLIEQLTYALGARVIVEQAKGITANDRQVSVEKAYQLIRRHARCHNATVRAVSDAIVNTGMRVAV